MSDLKTPRHVAIIMDGNGRWAQRRGHARIFGHVRGASRVREVVRAAGEAGVEALTLYTFSTENWSRPKLEVATLWRILKKFLESNLDELDREGVELRVVGEVERLEPWLQTVLYKAMDRLSGNTGLKLTLALSYGARREILRATQAFAEDCVRGKAKPEDLDESGFEGYLWTRELGDLAQVDLVLRTSGETRVSNFLLWQSAYAEYVFTDVCWPEFGARDFNQALQSYCQRERRYGGVLQTSKRDNLNLSANL